MARRGQAGHGKAVNTGGHLREIEIRLMQWGAWQRSVRLPNHGYPGADLVRRQVFGGQRPGEIVDVGAEAVEAAIVALIAAEPERWPRLADTLVLTYVDRCSLRQAADRLRRHHSTVARWLEMAVLEVDIEISLA